MKNLLHVDELWTLYTDKVVKAEHQYYVTLFKKDIWFSIDGGPDRTIRDFFCDAYVHVHLYDMIDVVEKD